MFATKMRTFSFKKKSRYTVNQSKETESVSIGMKELSLADRHGQTELALKERHQTFNENGLYNNIPRISMPGSCGQTSGPTQPARPDFPGTTARKMHGGTSGNVLGPTQTLACAGNVGLTPNGNVGLTNGNFGLIQHSWPIESYGASGCEFRDSQFEGDYQTIKDLNMSSAVDHDDVKMLRHDAQTLRHRLASTSSSSGVSSASEKSVASSLYASVKAILEKRRSKAAPEIKVTSPPTSPTSCTDHNETDNKIRITTKRSKSKWTVRSRKSVKSPKNNVKSPQSRGKSPGRRGKSPVRRRRRVVALARGLGCVGGARSRSVTPERHTRHRIHQLNASQKEDLNIMLQNVQQRVRNVIEDGRNAVNDVDGDHYKTNVTTYTNGTCYVADVAKYVPGVLPDVPPRVVTPKIKSATLGSDVTGRRLSRWDRHNDRHQSPPDLSDVICKRAATTMGRFVDKSDIQKRPLPPIPDPPRESSVSLIKTLDLSNVMKNSWISGMAVSRRDEIILVDLEQAYVVDLDGNLKRIIANKNARSSQRLTEPIDVCVLNDGTMIFSDHADRQVKMFNTRGQHLRSIHNQCHMNIAGVTCNDSGQIFVAGTDSGCVSIYGNQQGPPRHIPEGSQLEHPYSVAVNPLTGSIIVGDDYKQLVIALSDKGKVLWRYCPTGERHFFPSSICVDNDGYVFIADLYNEKIYMLDSGGKLLKTLLSKGQGLHGGPGAIACDGKGHLYVADQEKSLKVFKYGQGGFAMYRRFSIVRK